MATRVFNGRKLLAGLAATAFVCGAAAAPAGAQDEWTQQVRNLLQQAGKTFQERGYSMTHNIYTGSLKDDAQGTVTLQLNGGMQYQIMGACDTDCSDMDLVLYDPSGKQISSDLQDDDFPIVSASPSKSGTYSLRVIMAECNDEPCRYGIGAFGK